MGERCKLAQWGPGEATGKCGSGAFRGLNNQLISTVHCWLAVFSSWSCAKKIHITILLYMTPLHHAVNDAHVRTRVSAMTSMMMTLAEQSLRYISVS